MRDRSSMPPPPRYNVELAEFFPLSLGSGPLLSTLYLGEGGLGEHDPLHIMSQLQSCFVYLQSFFLPPLGFIEIALVAVSCEPLPQDAPVTSSGLVWALGQASGLMP